jgi:hypothetical protein
LRSPIRAHRANRIGLLAFSQPRDRASAAAPQSPRPDFDQVRVWPQQEAVALYAEEAVVTASSVTRCGLHHDVVSITRSVSGVLIAIRPAPAA